MDRQYIDYWNFEFLIKRAAEQCIDKYHLEFLPSRKNISVLRNEYIYIYIYIYISDRYGDFSIDLYDSDNNKIASLADLILIKEPNYIRLLRENKIEALYTKKISDFDNYDDYFVYLVKIGFEFIEENFSEIFTGKYHHL